VALTPEQRRRIYEEEKTRIEAQAHFAATRTGALESTIEDYQRRGYRIVSRTETAVQLVKPRRYNPTWGCLGFLTLGVFWIIGLLDFLVQKDRLIYLRIDSRGQILTDEKTPVALVQGRLDAVNGWLAIAVVVVVIAVIWTATHH